jgi:hypothetical protein
MAGINRINPVVGSEYGTSLNVTGTKQSFFSGYQPLIIKIAGTGIATLDTQATPTSAIVEGTRTKALRAVQTFGSVLMTDDADATTALTVIVDGATFNQGNSNTVTTGFGLLKAAVASATGVSSGSITITSSTVLNSDGSITYA